MRSVIRLIGSATCTLTLLLSVPSLARAAGIPMPAGSRSWIKLEANDCNDGSGGPDASDCIGGVSQVNGTVGTHQTINVDASVDANGMHGLITQTVGGFVFLDMSMVDTYTVHSTNLPDGSVIPLTVTFQATGTLHPFGFGGANFQIRISNTFDTDPFVEPEGSRVGAPLVPSASQSIFNYPAADPTPLNLTATWSFDATLGAPFDLAYYLGATPSSASIDFSHSAHIGFTLPDGVSITSTGGFGGVTRVQHDTWGRLKRRYR